MSDDILLKWDNKYRSRKDLSGNPAYVLISNLHLLPARGLALDLACGPGANAIMLAESGLNTQAWDISEVALSYLDSISKSRNLNISINHRDAIQHPPPPDSFDVIVVSNFLDRSIIPNIISALRADGLVFYQTFTRARTSRPAPNNPRYKLDNNELLRLFDTLTVRYYREDGHSGTDHENQGLAMLVAQKTGNKI